MDCQREDKSLSVWVLLLSLASGYSNITAMMRFNQSVSHMTGVVSQLALAIFDREALIAVKLFAVLICFLLGAIFSGYIFHQRKLEPKKRYGTLLFFVGILILLLRNSEYLFYFLAFFMGLQNSMFLMYRRHLVRSTHLTGYISEIGFELGSSLAKTSKDPWKITFYSLSIFLFILGGLLSAYLKGHNIQVEFLSGLYLFLGSSYFLLVRKRLFRKKA
ncbi:MAG: DUF1275 domain-containing protein [Fastidiosipila sp.]|nr:DUF1275 domain-containing protein [Fastidiosipila sp.]